ncbi:hypothetical protein O181_041081 [Austropuccinia psidii MF-1]|uniref:Reverse transcriptase domain-containing protein n=1 Tax=Austropuccinia psidii MF-1 TaxID=1389203 RepID=A0A9Q3DJ18_9BASI|nr:hypothetical protein [Austropuccinia psidii MF-1]
MSEFVIHRRILRQCGGDLEHAVKSRTTEQSSSEDIINILEEVITRTRIGSSRHKSADIIRKCHICQSTIQFANTCPKRGKINEIDIEKKPHVEKEDNIIEENSDDKPSIFSQSSKDIYNINATFDIMESYSHLPQLSNGKLHLSRIQDAQLMKTKPNRGKGYTAGSSCITEVVIDTKPTKRLLDPGAICSCVGKSFLKICVQNFKHKLLPNDDIKFNSASNQMKKLEIFEINVIFTHINGSLRITVKFVMKNCSSTHFILENDYLIMYGIDLHNNKERYFTIGDNKHQKLALLPFKSQITVSKVAPDSLELERFKSEQLNEAKISLHLTDSQENDLSALLNHHREAFASEKEPWGEIIGHEVDIILNIERPYPPILRRPAYPASPKSREALEIHIKELLEHGVIRKVGNNEEVEITTPVIVAWHNEKSRMVGDLRALNTYTFPDRYPIPKIQIALTQISQAVNITTLDSLKGFHQDVVTQRAKKYLRIIFHCGVYECLRMALHIKNAP